jgi:hypothetical protein
VIKKAKEQQRVAAEKQSCLETARPFTFRADLLNERRRDESYGPYSQVGGPIPRSGGITSTNAFSSKIAADLKELEKVQVAIPHSSSNGARRECAISCSKLAPFFPVSHSLH